MAAWTPPPMEPGIACSAPYPPCDRAAPLVAPLPLAVACGRPLLVDRVPRPSLLLA